MKGELNDIEGLSSSKRFNNKIEKSLKKNSKKGELPKFNFIWKSDNENLGHSHEYEEVTRADWWRRWLYSTNAKDILRHGGLFQCILFNYSQSKKCGELKWIHLVDDLDKFEKQGGWLRLLILNVVWAEVLGNRGVKLGMQKRFYNTCRKFKRITWAKANRCFKMGSLARRFLIPKLQRNIVERFSYVINRRSSYFSIPIQTTSYTLWSIYNSIKKLIKHGIIILIEEEIEHNGNKLNMVTSDNEIIHNVKEVFMLRRNSSVAIFKRQIDIELNKSKSSFIPRAD